jgi:hypothetical protein
MRISKEKWLQAMAKAVLRGYFAGLEEGKGCRQKRVDSRCFWEDNNTVKQPEKR